MIEQERREGAILVFDAGASLAPLHHPEPWTEGGRGLEQRRLKAGLIAQAYELAGLDGLALGGNDWALGRPFLWDLIEAHDLPVLIANLTCSEDTPIQKGRVLEVGGRRIGLVGVTDGPVEGCEVDDPVASASEALRSLGEVDLSIGLVPFRSRSEVEAMGAVGFDVMLDGQGRHTLGEIDRAQDSLLYGAGSRGKHVGVLTATWSEGHKGWRPDGDETSLQAKIERYEQRIGQLDERLAREVEPPRIVRLEAQREAYARQREEAKADLALLGKQAANVLSYREIPLSRDVVDHGPTSTLVSDALKAMLDVEGAPIRYHLEPHVAPEKSPFAGSDVCVGCHKEEHAQWSLTPHAHAWQTLVLEQRHLDHDCFGCHSTGAWQRGGPTTPSRVVGLRDVQCESCHGPSKAHTQRPMSVRPVRIPEIATCTECHDGDRDEGRFQVETYWPKILH